MPTKPRSADASVPFLYLRRSHTSDTVWVRLVRLRQPSRLWLFVRGRSFRLCASPILSAALALTGCEEKSDVNRCPWPCRLPAASAAATLSSYSEAAPHDSEFATGRDYRHRLRQSVWRAGRTHSTRSASAHRSYLERCRRASSICRTAVSSRHCGSRLKDQAS